MQCALVSSLRPRKTNICWLRKNIWMTLGCRCTNALGMLSPEVILTSLHSSILVYCIQTSLEEEGFGSDWDSEHFGYLTDCLPSSSYLPLHRVIYLVLSWADCAPQWIGPSPHCWAQRFLTRLVYTHLEGDQYIEPSSDSNHYPLPVFYWSA